MDMDRQLDKAIFQQMDQRHAKFLNTGTSDTTREDFLESRDRDLLAVYMLHGACADYAAMGLQVHPAVLRSEILLPMLAKPLRDGREDDEQAN